MTAACGLISMSAPPPPYGPGTIPFTVPRRTSIRLVNSTDLGFLAPGLCAPSHGRERKAPSPLGTQQVIKVVLRVDLGAEVGDHVVHAEPVTVWCGKTAGEL